MPRRNYAPIGGGPRQPLIQVHLADIHFGCVNPQTEYQILVEQFLNPIKDMPFHIMAIDGDLFDKKFMANSEPIKWAARFIGDCISLCTAKNATIIAIEGTQSHDFGQWQIFEYFEKFDDIDFRIVRHIQFEYVFGYKILCIPEEYGKGEEYYREYLDQVYDTVFMHGTIAGSVYGCNKEDLNSIKYPIFDLCSFSRCRGPIISGHVHKAMCLKGYMYYVSNPIRYKFGEEEPKGYCIVLQNDNGAHYFEFMPIESFRYDTIRLSQCYISDPKEISAYIDNLQANGVDHVKLKFDVQDEITYKIIMDYYANNPNVVVENNMRQKISEMKTTTESIAKKYEGLDFLMDPSISELDKLIRFINFNEGKEVITVEQFKSILS